jgi:adenosine deaminase
MSTLQSLFHSQRQLFALTGVMNRLLQGERVGFDDIRRELFVRERASAVQLPDHMHKSHRAAYLQGVGESIGELILHTVTSLAADCIEQHTGRYYLRHEALQAWSDLGTRVSPLLLLVARLRNDHGPIPSCADDVAPFVAQHLFDHLGPSSLLMPYDHGMQHIVDKEGLVESHMHLNGTTESDRVWLHALEHRRDVVSDLLEADRRHPSAVRELMQQVDPHLSIDGLAERLRVARRLRWALLEVVRPVTTDAQVSPQSAARAHLLAGLGPVGALRRPLALERYRAPLTLEEFAELRRLHPLMGADFDRQRPIYLHPAAYRGIQVSEDMDEVFKEALFLYQMLDAISLPTERGGGLPDSHLLGPVTFGDAAEEIARSFYLYLLIWMGNLQPLLVQQVDQYGFDQFQKFTLDGIREPIERLYGQRYDQLARSRERSELAILEGRFAPKSDGQKLHKLVHSIVNGHIKNARRRHRSARREAGSAAITESNQRSSHDLRLVVHFIKAEDRKYTRAHEGGGNGGSGNAKLGTFVRECRHRQVRIEVCQQWQLLMGLKQRYPEFAERFVGIDAASNELHAPPEVFAPLYRMARHAHVTGFTYHVGEDFNHLVSGIRAIEEAVLFLGLSNGDRIGHGTAVGIRPAQWREHMPPCFRLRRGEWLDNLVYAYGVFSRQNGRADAALRCRDAAEKLVAELYCNELGAVSLETLLTAWRLRELDAAKWSTLPRPLHTDPRAADHLNLTAMAQECQDRTLGWLAEDDAREWRRLYDACVQQPHALHWFDRYHDAANWPRCSEYIEINTDFFALDELLALQHNVLSVLQEQRVIIETLPTSNVRISYYVTHDDHHVFRWLGLAADATPADQVPVIVGSDDPGIFATCMRLEYEYLRDAAKRTLHMSDGDSLRMVENLVKDSHRNAFATTGWRPPGGEIGRLLRVAPPPSEADEIGHIPRARPID